MTSTKAKAVPVVEVSPTVNVSYRSTSFVVHTDPMDWGYEAMDHLADSKLGPALESILGPEQYMKFKTSRPSAREATDLLNSIAETAGSDSGN